MSPLLSSRSRASDETDRGWAESRVNRSLRRVVIFQANQDSNGFTIPAPERATRSFTVAHRTSQTKAWSLTNPHLGKFSCVHQPIEQEGQSRLNVAVDQERRRAVSDQRYDTAMLKSGGRGWRYHVGLLGVMFMILGILWLTGNLKQAPPLLAPGLDFSGSQPATRR